MVERPILKLWKLHMYLYVVPFCNSETQPSVIHWVQPTTAALLYIVLGCIYGEGEAQEALKIYPVFVIHLLLASPPFLVTLALFLLEEISTCGTA